MFLDHVSDLKLAPVDQNMPKPKSPERPLKKKVEVKITSASKKSQARVSRPDPIDVVHEDVVHEDVVQDVYQEKQDYPAKVHDKVYPTLIRDLLSICIGEVSEVRDAFKNRNRQKYKNIFDSYKDKLSDRDYSIIKGALFYLYDFSRVKSINKETALWMIGIYEIPISQIISYTSKDVLKSIAKDHGLSYSNKKAEDLVESIRGVIDPSN